MAARADASPAEVAEHWRRAEDPSEEVTWRVAAAQAATQRFALAQAAQHWRRALDLWPDGVGSLGTPPVRKLQAGLAALDALVFTDLPAAWELAEWTLSETEGAPALDAAAVYRRAGSIRGWLDDPEGGLELVGRALALHRAGPPTVEHVRALHERDTLLNALGRYDEAREAAALALKMCEGLDAPTLHRSLLIQQSFHDIDGPIGDLERAFARLDAAAALELGGPDPQGDI
jgi:tetratricopeptide (TPR) repeat protein